MKKYEKRQRADEEEGRDPDCRPCQHPKWSGLHEHWLPSRVCVKMCRSLRRLTEEESVWTCAGVQHSSSMRPSPWVQIYPWARGIKGLGKHIDFNWWTPCVGRQPVQSDRKWNWRVLYRSTSRWSRRVRIFFVAMRSFEPHEEKGFNRL